jgi:HSP20 family molecular chaperone IbpA
MELSLRTVCETPVSEGCGCFSIPDSCTDNCLDECCDECCECSVMPIDVAETCCTFSPDIDVRETKASIMVTAELPGMDKKDIDVSVHEGVLTLSGEKKIGGQKKGTDCYQMERSYGSFSRSMCLPDTVDSKNMKTVYKHGVLTLTIPKTVKTA